MKKILTFALVAVFAPSVTFAAATAFTILGIAQSILNVVIPVLITIAVIIFIWGVVSYIMAKEDDQKTKARQKILNGLIGLFVIVAFWGILNVVSRTFGVSNDQAPSNLPCIPNPSLGIRC
jgi:uncharacterized membrane protein YfcA